MIESRGMSKEQAAAHAGCETLSAFNDWIRRGIMPMSRTRVPSNLLRRLYSRSNPTWANLRNKDTA